MERTDELSHGGSHWVFAASGNIVSSHPTITEYSHEQGLTPRKMKIEELFAEETLGL